MFLDAVTWAVSQLRAAGLNACSDPADLNTPGVWVAPATTHRPTLDQVEREVTLTLYLVTGSAAVPAILSSLDSLAAAVDTVVPLGDLEAVTLALPNHHLAGLPAYRSTLTVTVTP